MSMCCSSNGIVTRRNVRYGSSSSLLIVEFKERGEITFTVFLGPGNIVIGISFIHRRLDTRGRLRGHLGVHSVPSRYP